MLYVKDAINSSYLSTLFVAMFFTPSNNTLLTKKPVYGEIIYMQEYIMTNFINNIRHGRSVTGDVINNIRVLCVRNGWSCNKQFFDTYPIEQFYLFINTLFSGEQMKFVDELVTFEALADPNDIGPESSTHYIELTIPSVNTRLNKTETSIKEMFNLWSHSEVDVDRYVITEHNNEIHTIRAINVHRLINLPNIIAMSINRFTPSGQRLYDEVDIQEQIAPLKQRRVKNIIIPPITCMAEVSDTRWEIQSVCCMHSDGHYYTVVKHDAKWYMFDCTCIPSFWEINMNYAETRHIRQNCVFVLYRKYNYKRV